MEATWWTRPEQLDREQKDVVALPIDGNHLVTGPPGCGKTNLLLLRGAYLDASKKHNYQILTLGRVLREFLVSGKDTTDIASDKINTYVKWASDILDNLGIEFRVDGNFDQQRAAILEKLSGLPDEDIQDFKLDCLLIDECQDYSADEIRTLARFAGQIFAAGDGNQQIYNQRGGISELKTLCPSQKTLTYHYRNGIKICRVADGIMQRVGKATGMEATSQYKEGEAASQVLHFEAESIEAQISRAIPILTDQLRAYPNSMLGALCPLREDVKQVWRALSASHLQSHIQLQLGETGYTPLDPERRILVGTTHGAKGLEFRALHLFAMEGISRFPRNRVRLAYTAVTRAKTSLSIYRGGPLIGALDNGLAALAPPAGQVDLKSLFKA